MKILVTGANGYLGRGIVKKLLDDGNEVIATDFQTDKVDSRAKCYSVDLFKIENPYEYFKKPQVVLHLAWKDGFVHNSLAHFEYLDKHYLFLKNLVDSGLKQLAVMGTMHEVGYYEGKIDEYTPCKPMSLYGISKYSLYLSLKAYLSDKEVDFQWLRGFYIVSEDTNGKSIFSKIALAVQNGKTTFPFTTGKNAYDFIDYSVFCYQVSKILQQNKVCDIINICSGYPEKLSDRVERFIKDNQYNIVLRYGIYPDRIYDSPAVWGDSSKVDSIIKKAETINIKEKK